MRDESPNGLIFSIQHFSIHDGPGIRSTVFFKGCPLTCHWCHNPESLSMSQELETADELCILCGRCADLCPQRAIIINEKCRCIDRNLCTVCGLCAEKCPSGSLTIKGEWRNVNSVLAEVLEDMPFYMQSNGGITLSGGEPLLQKDFCKALLEAAKKFSISTALDTSGYVKWSIIEELLPTVDLFLFDVKCYSETLHRVLTGVSNRQILTNLNLLLLKKAPVQIRIPVIPGKNDKVKEIEAISHFIAERNPQINVDLLPYHFYAEQKYKRLGRQYSLQGLQPPTRDQLKILIDIIEKAGLKVSVPGVKMRNKPIFSLKKVNYTENK
jgi:pyruvate formate lyase activating enzyme